MAQAPSGSGGDPPDTTMEEGDPHSHSAKKYRASKRSFADAVASFNTKPTDDTSRIDNNGWAFEDVDIVSDAEPDVADLADGRPRVSFSKELRRELCSAWKMSIIIKYLGKNVHVNVLNQRLPGIWNLQGKMTLIDIGFGCFVARLDNKVDYLHVLLDGPWKIFDNYLVTQRWEPGFRPRTAKFSKMAVWVRLPELPMEYFRDDTIREILENVGKPLKLDKTTVVATKGRFARAAVEIDLNKSLVTEVWVDNEIQLVEYEGLHVVCFHCGVVGHREQMCPEKKSAETEVPIVDLNSIPNPETVNNQQTQTATPPPQVQEKRRFGTWMLVTKKPKSGDTGKNTRNSRKVSNTPSVNHGNQFSLLEDINEDSEPTINRQHADKNKSRTAPRQTSKGKHSNPPLNSPPVPPQPRTPLPATTSTPPARVHTQTARHRGGRPAAARGRDRELNRVHGLKHDIPLTNSSFAGLMNQPNSQNVFQFGGSHPPSSNMTGIPFNLADTGSPSCSTPGEGGVQTSPVPTGSL